jgi:hypothetical protein
MLGKLKLILLGIIIARLENDKFPDLETELFWELGEENKFVKEGSLAVGNNSIMRGIWM